MVPFRKPRHSGILRASGAVAAPIKALAKELARSRKDFRALAKGTARAFLKEALDNYVIGGLANENRREVVIAA